MMEKPLLASGAVSPLVSLVTRFVHISGGILDHSSSWSDGDQNKESRKANQIKCNSDWLIYNSNTQIDQWISPYTEELSGCLPADLQNH